MTLGFQWSAAIDDRMRQLRKAGLPWSEIGRTLGCGKDSAIGRGKRIGIVGAPPAVRVGPSPILNRPRRSKTDLVSPTPIRRPNNPNNSLPPRVPSAPIPLSQGEPGGVHRDVLANRGCRWPMWGTGQPTHIYCGDTRDGAETYCERHCRQAYPRYKAAA